VDAGVIKARGMTKDGRDVLLLGLSRRNTELLLDGQPIRVDTALKPPHGLAIADGPVILIIAGETEEQMATDVQAALYGSPG
jgi:hypothetical protein